MSFPIQYTTMDSQGHFEEHYDDHYAHEHSYSADNGHHSNDDLFYDPDAHAASHGVEYEAGHEDGSIDYEPPSPSYPYPEDQQPPDSVEDLESRDLSSRNPRHVSELYNDAVSGTDLDQGSSVISEYLRSKDPYWDNVQERSEPLNLLELPVDVLRLIVKEVRTPDMPNPPIPKCTPVLILPLRSHTQTISLLWRLPTQPSTTSPFPIFTRALILYGPMLIPPLPRPRASMP